MPIATKRVYEKPGPGNGYRVLVDGLWPRGFTKDAVKIHEWLKEIAPSVPLRKWYGHKPQKWAEFRRRFRAELSKPPRSALLDQLVERARQEKVTLVFAARDTERCNATVIAEMIREKL